MSLIQILHSALQEKGYLSYDEVESICKVNQYKPETGRRRLEKDESQLVEHVMGIKQRDGREYVKGYRWKEIKLSSPYKQEFLDRQKQQILI